VKLKRKITLTKEKNKKNKDQIGKNNISKGYTNEAFLSS
jgi:hypothetical protein